MERRENAMGAELNEKALDQGLAALETARTWSPRVISKLESHLRSAEDKPLFRINPFAFAADKNIAEGETIDLFLHATSVGLFEMSWMLVCPLCSCVVESFQSLKGVHNHYHCFVCQEGFEAKLDEFIAVSFTVSPNVRDIAFHYPDRLSPREHFFDYCGLENGHIADGTPFVKVQESVTRAVSHLPIDETVEMTVNADGGSVIGVSHEGGAAFLYSIEGQPTGEDQRFAIEFGEPVYKYSFRKVTPGRMTFAVRNVSGDRGTFLIAVLPPGFVPGHMQLEFDPFLTGKRLLTTQTFRNLFRSEVIRASEGIGVTDLALLFTDLKGSTALYDRIGDLNAFALVQLHFERLQEVTARHGGAIIKTIGDAVMAAFLAPADAVRAALAMRDEIASFNRSQPNRELILKIGVHKGAAIAVTLNDRLDYFGQTVNIAARVQNLADSDEIYISQDVHEAAGVGDALSGFAVDPHIIKLRGVNQDVRVFRIAPGSQGGLEPGTH
jgi:class 3 adenylate cyclase